MEINQFISKSPSMPDMVKIGYTKGDPIDRAHQISKQINRCAYSISNVVYSYNCFNGERIEKLKLINIFRKQRVNSQREFFYVDVDEADSKTHRIIRKLN
jgi:hypothetical protein